MGGLSKRQRSVEVNQHRHSVISRVSTTMEVKKTIWVEFPNKEENLSQHNLTSTKNTFREIVPMH